MRLARRTPSSRTCCPSQNPLLQAVTHQAPLVPGPTPTDPPRPSATETTLSTSRRGHSTWSEEASEGLNGTAVNTEKWTGDPEDRTLAITRSEQQKEKRIKKKMRIRDL